VITRHNKKLLPLSRQAAGVQNVVKPFADLIVLFFLTRKNYVACEEYNIGVHAFFGATIANVR